jgi:hypothetical protein
MRGQQNIKITEDISTCGHFVIYPFPAVLLQSILQRVSLMLWTASRNVTAWNPARAE